MPCGLPQGVSLRLQFGGEDIIIAYLLQKEKNTMNIEVFVLCDAAADYQGKLNILGSFDSIWSKKVPAVNPHCALALRMRFLKIEEGEHAFRINIVNEDGQPVISPFETKLDIRPTDVATGSIARNMILNLQGLKFEKFGEYSIDLAVDGRHELSIPLYVNQAPDQS